MAPSKMSFLFALLVALAVATPSAAFSFPALLPCIPGLPRIPLFPCIEPPPPLKKPTECRTSLMKMVPACTGYLTNSSVTVPTSFCCEGFNPVGEDGGAICFCHVANGDVQQLLPAPMNFTRMLSITRECGINLRMEALVENCDTFDVPPMTAPSPPPSPAT